MLLSRSPGTPSQDEIAHVVIARHAWHDPHLILDAWGRPVNTLLYLLPSRFGLTGARIGSIMFASVTVLLATLIAREVGLRRLYLIPLLLWFQPWFADLGHFALTEVPFSMILTLAIYAWMKGHRRIAALTFGLLPLVRWEALALIPLGALALLISRRWRLLGVLAAPLVTFLGLSVLFGGENMSLREYLATPAGAYGYGTWGHFFATSSPLIGPPVLLSAAFGSLRAIRDLRVLAISSVWGTYFILQVLSWRFGKGAGYAEFALPVAPGIAVLAALGVESAVASCRRIRLRPIARTLVFAVLVFVTVATLVAGVRNDTHPLDGEALAMRDAARWLRVHAPIDPEIISTHAWFQYFYELPFRSRHTGLRDGGRNVGAGTIMVWDIHYSNRWGYRLEDLMNPRNGWEHLATFRGKAAIFRKR